MNRLLQKASPLYWGLLLLAGAFTLATVLQPRATAWSPRAEAGSLMKVLLGDGRRLFADFFFRKADIYFHSGYYPSIFDQANRPKDARHMAVAESHAEPGHDGPEGARPGDDHEGHDHGTEAGAVSHEDAHEREMAFLQKPRDWIERFGRKFMITAHTHLEAGGEREILPWLRITADLDPQKVETYTVAAFWLRSKLGREKEAEEFLREGLKSNPDSYEILLELGLIYSKKEPVRARNVMELALRRWTEQAAAGKKPSEFSLEQISAHLARMEEDAGNLQQAINYLQITKRVAPIPEFVQKQIDELKARLQNPPTGR